MQGPRHRIGVKKFFIFIFDYGLFGLTHVLNMKVTHVKGEHKLSFIIVER
jgi:hypothetical protein